jgi:hypothetical protein
VSQRSKRRREPREGRGEGAAGPGRGQPARPEAARGRPGAPGEAVARRPGTSDWSLGVQIALLVGVFAVTVLIAELAGAANLGVALGVGQITFILTAIYLLVRR